MSSADSSLKEGSIVMKRAVESTRGWAIIPPSKPGTYWVCRGDKRFTVSLSYDDAKDTWTMSGALLEISWRSGEYNLKVFLWWPEVVEPPPAYEETLP